MRLSASGRSGPTKRDPFRSPRLSLNGNSKSDGGGSYSKNRPSLSESFVDAQIVRYACSKIAPTRSSSASQSLTSSCIMQMESIQRYLSPMDFVTAMASRNVCDKCSSGMPAQCNLKFLLVVLKGYRCHPEAHNREHNPPTRSSSRDRTLQQEQVNLLLDRPFLSSLSCKLVRK